MRVLVVLIGCFSLVLYSCQKEADFANAGNRGGNTSPSLLLKTVARTGADSIVTTYTYNTNKQLVRVTIIGTEQGTPVNKEYRYYRNTSGILTYYSAFDSRLIAAGIDSIVTVTHYDGSSSRYTGYVLNVNTAGVVLLDSSAFVYDNDGHMIEEDVFESPSGSANDYYLTGKLGYTYSNGNISQLDIHDLDQTGAETFTATNKVGYDLKANPLNFGNEAFVLGHPEWVTPNNISNELLSDSNGPADNQTVNINYVYNSNNQPTSSVATVIPDNTLVSTSYFYQ